jgi:hypothetical protein
MEFHFRSLRLPTPSQNSSPTQKYGSRYHFLSYRDRASPALDEAITSSIAPKLPELSLEWIYPRQRETRPEPTGTEFLELDRTRQAAWQKFWPQTGTLQTWDGVARCRDVTASAWVLIEAKANHPEFCSPPSGATSRSLIQIRHSLDQTKKALGVHRFFPWHGTYYQYANRLAFLFFLKTIGISAHLVFLYFYGDRFPDETPCPGSPERWRDLIRACHLTLGLPDRHALQPWIHDVFLPVPAPRSTRGESFLRK